MNNIEQLLEASTIFWIFLTCSIFIGFQKICGKINFPLLNPYPLTFLTIIILLKLAGLTYDVYEEAGQYLKFFLTPTTVCFAIPLYRQITVLKENAKAIIVSIILGSFSAVTSIFILSKIAKLPFEVFAGILPKSVTLPIATAITNELGGYMGVIIVTVVITGISGAIFAIPLQKLLRIKSPVSLGLATGTSSHAIGTSSLMGYNEVAAAMSSLSIALAGVVTVILAPIFASFY